MVATRHPQALSQNAEVDPMGLLTVNYSVHGAVDVQQQTIVTTVLRQRSVCSETTSQEVMHDDGGVDFLREGCPFHHLLTGRRGNVQVVTLDFTGFRLSLLNSFLNEQEAITPTHEGLRVDVFVVFGEVQTTT